MNKQTALPQSHSVPLSIKDVAVFLLNNDGDFNEIHYSFVQLCIADAIRCYKFLAVFLLEWFSLDCRKGLVLVLVLVLLYPLVG